MENYDGGAVAQMQPRPWAWLMGVIVDPVSTFREMAGHTHARHPEDPAKTKDNTGWLRVAIVLAVVSAVLGALFVAFAVMPSQREAVLESIEAQGVSGAEIDQAMRIGTIVGGVFGGIGSAIKLFVLIFAVAGVYTLFMLMGKGKGTFRHARAIVTYSFVIPTLGMLIKVPVAAAKQTVHPEFGPTLFFPDLDPMGAVFQGVYAGLDIFTLWWIIVLVFGFAAVYKVSKLYSFLAALLLWLITTGAAVGGALLGNAFGGGPFGMQ